MNWVQLGPHLFDKDEIVIFSEVSDDHKSVMKIGLRGGHSIEVRQDDERFKDVISLWEDFYKKAHPGHKGLRTF
jgi:hypothetical protein